MFKIVVLFVCEKWKICIENKVLSATFNVFNLIDHVYFFFTLAHIKCKNWPI